MNSSSQSSSVEGGRRLNRNSRLNVHPSSNVHESPSIGEIGMLYAPSSGVGLGDLNGERKMKEEVKQKAAAEAKRRQALEQEGGDSYEDNGD